MSLFSELSSATLISPLPRGPLLTSLLFFIPNKGEKKEKSKRRKYS